MFQAATRINALLLGYLLDRTVHSSWFDQIASQRRIVSSKPSMPTSQRVVQVCLFLVAAIAVFGGSLQMYLGEPEVSAHLDNVHRFMAGVYLSTGLISFWAAITIRRQGTSSVLAPWSFSGRYRKAACP